MSNLPPVTLEIVAGCSSDFARSTPNADGTFGGVYTGIETITATIWPEDSEVYVLKQVGYPNVWINAATTTWLVSFTDAQTATLTPGIYRMQVTAPVLGRTGPLFEGMLEVFSAPGTAAPNNLASAFYVGKALTEINLSPGQWEYLPDTIAVASSLFRIYCRRQFTQGVYIETVPVEKDGTIRLREIPVNQIARIQCQPRQALSIRNGSAAQSWVSSAQVGDVYSGITINGIQLNWQNNGVLNTQVITFAANETIASLATAIGAVSGWSASASSVFGPLPVTELVDLEMAKGSGPNDQPECAAIYRVYSQVTTTSSPLADNGYRTGIIGVGQQYSGVGPRWGPGWEEDSDRLTLGRVRVTYNGGFATVPHVVQEAIAEIVKANFERLATDAFLKSETARNYSYQIAEELIGNMPKAARQTAESFKVRNA